MYAVVVTESCFGNTARVAEAITEGLRSAGADVETYVAAAAPPHLAADLVLVGAPTHNLGLSTPASRSQAAQQGAGVPATGAREWIDSLQGVDGQVVAFSTTTGGVFAGSAGKAIVRALRRRKVKAERGADFTVTGTPGPLADGEIDRARAWGISLAG